VIDWSKAKRFQPFMLKVGDGDYTEKKFCAYFTDAAIGKKTINFYYPEAWGWYTLLAEEEGDYWKAIEIV